MHSEDMLHIARVAMLQAAISAYFADVETMGADTLMLEVTRDEGGAVQVDAQHHLGGKLIEGYDL